MDIRIHPKGSGRVTDSQAVLLLNEISPKSLSIAKNLLTATAKHNGGFALFALFGFFSTPESRYKKVTDLLDALLASLKAEGFFLSASLLRVEESTTEVINASPQHLLVHFLCLVSDAYPNWQHEYSTMNSIIQSRFTDSDPLLDQLLVRR